MKKTKIVVVVLLSVFSLLLFTACNEDTVSENQNEVARVEKSTEDNNEVEVKYLESSELDDSMQVIDIRNPEYFIGWKNTQGVSGHIDNATDFPVTWFDYEKSEEHLNIELKRRYMDKDKKTVLYSDDEVTLDEYNQFKNLGFKDVYALKGGINEYAKEGKKLSKLKDYSMYVSPRWVDELIAGNQPEGYNGEDYVIVEVSLPSEKDEYTSGHIKGAVNIDTDTINHIAGSKNLMDYEGMDIEEQRETWGMPKLDVIKESLKKLGINQDTMVILYATEKTTTGANRTAFVLDYAGVKNIKLINGGKKLWKLENRDLETTINQNKEVVFGAEIPQRKEIEITYKEELELVEDKNAVIASVRSWEEYLGNIPGYTYIDKAGDIKNSRFAYAGSNPYAMEDYRNLDNTMFNYEISKDRLVKWGITPDKRVSFHCGTGWRAAEVYYIAKAMGYENIGVYIGGWWEWIHYDDSPVKDKGVPKDAPETSPEEYFYK